MAKYNFEELCSYLHLPARIFAHFDKRVNCITIRDLEKLDDNGDEDIDSLEIYGVPSLITKVLIRESKIIIKRGIELNH